MDRFQVLLSPLSKSDFFEGYWGKRAVHVPNRASPHKFHDLPGMEAFPQLLQDDVTPDGRWSKRRISARATLIDAQNNVRWGELGRAQQQSGEPVKAISGPSAFWTGVVLVDQGNPWSYSITSPELRVRSSSSESGRAPLRAAR